MIKKETQLLEFRLQETKLTKENYFYLMEVAWNLAAYLLSLLIANRNTSGNFMKLKRCSFDHTCKPVRTSNLYALT